jgi:hypothetical protein
MALNSIALEKVVKILKKPPDRRTSEDIIRIQHTTIKIEFFRKLAEQRGVDAHLACWKVLGFEKYEEGDTIFEYGDKGKTFCVILKGRVGIYVPTTAYIKN